MAFDNASSGPQWSKDSHFIKEMKKWEKPYAFQKFPQMMHRARRPEGGGPLMCSDPNNDQFSASCQLIVQNEHEMEQAKSEGWREHPDEAIAHVKGLENDISMAAAHRAHEDRNMSEAAKAEVQAAEDATAEQVPEIPRTPVHRGPGRPRTKA